MKMNAVAASQLWPIAGLQKLKKVGHITPSSNTALEPLTALMNRGFESAITHHFARIVVRQLKLNETSAAQFDLAPMLDAARLLADAPLDAQVWNGTSASWLGLENDQRLAEEIERQTGIAASTTTLAYYEAYKLLGVSRVALAVPYTDDLTQKIIAEYARHAVEVPSYAILDKFQNTEIGNTPLDDVVALIRRADSPQTQCISVVCTNLPAASLVGELEAELGKPILCSIALTYWKGCRLAGADSRRPEWGMLLDS